MSSFLFTSERVRVEGFALICERYQRDTMFALRWSLEGLACIDKLTYERE